MAGLLLALAVIAYLVFGPRHGRVEDIPVEFSGTWEFDMSAFKAEVDRSDADQDAKDAAIKFYRRIYSGKRVSVSPRGFQRDPRSDKGIVTQHSLIDTRRDGMVFVSESSFLGGTMRFTLNTLSGDLWVRRVLDDDLRIADPLNIETWRRVGPFQAGQLGSAPE